jgi:hypothetical protein
MKRRAILVAAMLAGTTFASGALAAPPEGKGQGHGGGPQGKGNPGKGNKPGKGNPHAAGKPGKGNSSHAGAPGQQAQYDSHGRNRAYFDDHRDDHGRLRDGDLVAGLVFAGITAALARNYAREYDLMGYSSLPPGIRKNLARGKPLPPGIAKKLVPGPLLGRLPRHPGYEWRIAGSDLILVAIATAVVADVLYDVFD